MALIVEDGSIVPNANSYVNVAYADAYFSARNNVAWAALDQTTQKEPFLVLAVDFMQQMYRQSWYGLRANLNQSLDWPRLWVPQKDVPANYGPAPYYYPPTLIPNEIKTAQCLLAVKIVNGDLSPDITREDTAAMVKVGSLQIEYDRFKPTMTIFRDVGNLLDPFLIAQANSFMARVGRS